MGSLRDECECETPNSEQVQSLRQAVGCVRPAATDRPRAVI